MIVPCVHGLFGRVCAMDVRWTVLDASLFRGNKCFNVFGCFVGEFMQERFEAAECEPGVDLAICTKKLFF